MAGFPSPFGGTDDDLFDDIGEFVPQHLPSPGAFLKGHDVLAGDDHVAVHRLAREVFEERGVYDMTFGYNLAKLDRDTRHPDAGYRYAEERDDASVLRAEFTPTTPFCPQSDTLAKGSFRALNGLRERHDYDLVRVRVAGIHHRSERINEVLAELETTFRETGEIPGAERGGERAGPGMAAGGQDGGVPGREPGGSDDDPDAPF